MEAYPRIVIGHKYIYISIMLFNGLFLLDNFHIGFELNEQGNSCLCKGYL